MNTLTLKPVRSISLTFAVLRLAILAGLLFCAIVQGVAQQTFSQWAAGKKGGIYLSRKNFSYTQDWLQYLNQFTQLGGPDIPRDDLKLATLVRLGQLFREELTEHIPGLQLVFLNEDPQAGGAWLSVLNTPNGQVAPYSAALDSFDFILTVESLNLYANQEKSVYSVSNQIRSEKRLIYNLESRIRITDGRNHLLQAEIPLRLMTDQTESLKPVLDFDNARSPGGVLLAELYSRMLEWEVK